MSGPSDRLQGGVRAVETLPRLLKERDREAARNCDMRQALRDEVNHLRDKEEQSQFGGRTYKEMIAASDTLIDELTMEIQRRYTSPEQLVFEFCEEAFRLMARPQA